MSLKLFCSTAILLLNSFLVKSNLYITDNYERMMVIKSEDKSCAEYNDRVYTSDALGKVESKSVFVTPRETYDEFLNFCNITNFKGFTLPGTKWCGPGTSAKSYADLGKFKDVDRCCRAHDFCPHFLEAGQCRRGICNNAPFTRSHCNCDEAFQKCLHDLNSATANLIGSLYFNIGQVPCFKERRHCDESIRENLSYSWFCEEWKFVPSKTFVPSPIANINDISHKNEIPDDARTKPEEHSKIDHDLENIFGNDDEITKIMNDYKTLRN